MQKNRKFVLLLIGLFVLTGTFWGIWIARAYVWVEYKDWQTSVFGTVLIALATVLIVDVYALFHLARPSFMLIKQKKNMLIVIFSVCLVMCINFLMLYQYRDYGYTISTITAITEKESEGGSYYFQITDSEDGALIRFVCDKEIYEKLRIEKEIHYSIQYRKLSFGKRKAVLGYIDTENTITDSNIT